MHLLNRAARQFPGIATALTGFAVRYLLALCLAAFLAACGQLPSQSRGPDYLPGGVRFYSAGSALDYDNYIDHIKRVQSNYGIFSKRRLWADSTPPAAPATLNMLQAYYPLHVRWELKDGRQFIAENIDIRALMREYFKSNDIQMQWQQEKRKQALGDHLPSLVYDVREDSVIVKWLIVYNHTPLDRRDKELPKIKYQQYVVATVKATTTTGIDFEKQWEFFK